MTAPLSDERLAEILTHAPNCRYGCVACESAPELVAEVQRVRRLLVEVNTRWHEEREAAARAEAERDQANGKLAAATRTVARLAATRVPGAECCAHCGKPRNGLGEIGGVKACHTGTNPAQFDPIDCYRLVTVYGEPLGARIGEPTATDDTSPDVCRDCYGRGDDFQGGACPRCKGTGAPS